MNPESAIRQYQPHLDYRPVCVDATEEEKANWIRRNTRKCKVTNARVSLRTCIARQEFIKKNSHRNGYTQGQAIDVLGACGGCGFVANKGGAK